MSDIREATAFFRESAIAQSKASDTDFPFKEVYDAMHLAVLPYMFERQLQPRHIASALMLLVFDIVSTAMAMSKYDKNAPMQEGQSFEGDMQGFIESIMILINATPEAVGGNARLLVDKLSIFNIKEKLDS